MSHCPRVSERKFIEEGNSATVLKATPSRKIESPTRGDYDTPDVLPLDSSWSLSCVWVWGGFQLTSLAQTGESSLCPRSPWLPESCRTLVSILSKILASGRRPRCCGSAPSSRIKVCLCPFSSAIVRLSFAASVRACLASPSYISMGECCSGRPEFISACCGSRGSEGGTEGGNYLLKRGSGHQVVQGNPDRRKERAETVKHSTKIKRNRLHAIPATE